MSVVSSSEFISSARINFYAGFADISYERMITDYLGARAGFEWSFLFETETTYCPFMITCISTPGEKKLEPGLRGTPARRLCHRPDCGKGEKQQASHPSVRGNKTKAMSTDVIKVRRQMTYGRWSNTLCIQYKSSFKSP
jgi:hypothetical protein